MALVLKHVDDFHTFLNKHADPRTVNWLGVSSPFYTVAICFIYLYIAKILGPKLMKNRKPIELTKTLIAYNLFQIFFSVWIFCQSGRYGWLTGRYSWICQPMDYSDDPDTIGMVHLAWWYYISKFTELMDTIFFILRKKYSHVTTLHVIHHGIMPMSVWFGVKFIPDGHSTFFAFLNTFVHIFMYTYYLLAAIGLRMQKYLWWKKYLTVLQLVQFVMIAIHSFQLLFIDCDYPRAVMWFIGMHGVMFFFLFKNFYNQAYSKKGKKKAETIAQSEEHMDYATQNEYIPKLNANKND